MTAPVLDKNRASAGPGTYVLDEQVGFILRQVQQRHAVIFAAAFDELTPLQWAALSKLVEIGECSQNELGRRIATDVATIKGVVERLIRRGFVAADPDPFDRRRLLLRPTPEGISAYEGNEGKAHEVSRDTLAPLSAGDRAVFLRLLDRLR